ncbi:hypothetical protein EKN06_12400 [Croceicoccus ponticola]|uniref:Uncharacterized protein n=1 Tax=Croceicoccus ponticola TaxID=2217664 RepID=A0A437GVG5_9SPHN|nr:hypothetical protein [Croceicoccus ponticola]RVQ65729.1 hypothetical protein EKN06_12400 [Croceicoccus ponticola]
MSDTPDFGRGPNGLALLCEHKLDELVAEKAECTDRQRVRAINKHMHTLRELLRFAKSRAGYTGN